MGHSDEGLDGINVLLLHFCNARAGGQQREPGQCLHIGIPLQLFRAQKERVVFQECWTTIDTIRQLLLRVRYLYGEDAGYPDGTADPLQTQ